MGRISLYSILLIVGYLLITAPCLPVNILPIPQIKSGSAKISGTIVSKQPNVQSNSGLTFFMYYPVSASKLILDISPDINGHFSIDIPVETDYTLVFLSVDDYECSNYIIGLDYNEETIINIYYNEHGEASIEVLSSFGLSSYDISNSAYVMEDMITGSHPFRKIAPEERLYEKDQDYYIQFSKMIMKYRCEIPDHNTNLSETAKQVLKNDLKFFLLNNQFFNYKTMLYINFCNTNPQEKHSEYANNLDLEKSHYNFLKDFDLNNPKNLYSPEYSKSLQTILINDTLALPRIKEANVNEWLAEAKAALADLVGFDGGLFYDLLVSNSYALQLNDELKPLSERQIANIKEYFKGGEIEKILLRKNHDVVKLDSEKSKLTVNETPAVANDKLMDAIVAKYKGKVVVVDFWATWCGPCMDAMEEMRPLKAELKDKDVVFAYITSVSSPKNRWSDIINSIGSEHYYLNAEQWVSIMDKYDFEGIPSYVIYDANGEMKHKFTGYRGNDDMRNKTNELLK